MADTTSISQSLTYEADGTMDDISDLITNISPDETPFLTTFGTAAKAINTSFDWFKDRLRPPMDNAHLEYEDYQATKAHGITRATNTIQHFQRSAMVSDTMQEVRKDYNKQDQMAYELEKATTQLSHDIEFAFVKNTISRLESGTAPALTGGVPYFMQMDIEPVTITIATPSVVTLSTTGAVHGLSTGDFVMFVATGNNALLPTGISSNKRYFVRLSATNPTTAFTLHPSLEDAVNNTNAIRATAAGTGTINILKNNIVDAGGTSITETMIDTAMEMALVRGGHPDTLYCSYRNKNRFTTALHSVNDVNRNQADKRVVNVTDVYQGDFGTVTAKPHLMYSDDHVDILDTSMFEKKWFRSPRIITLPKVGTYEKKVIEAAIGLKGTQPLSSSRIINLA